MNSPHGLGDRSGHRLLAAEDGVQQVDVSMVGKERDGYVGQLLCCVQDIKRAADLRACVVDKRQPLPGPDSLGYLEHHVCQSDHFP